MPNATVTWTTDIPATSWVEYGTSVAYGSNSGLIDPALVTSHSITLTGLAAGTLYHYRVHSRNSAGTETISGDQTFTTAGGTGGGTGTGATGGGAPPPPIGVTTVPGGPDRAVYFTPDGQQFMLSSPWFILQDDGFAMPPIEYVTQRGPFQHGESVRAMYFKPRTIQLVVRRNGCSRAEYWNLRNTLLTMLNPGRSLLQPPTPGILRRYLSNGVVREWDVYPTEGPGFPSHDTEVWDEWSVQDTIRFIAYDPIARDPAPHSVTFVSTGVPSTFPITFPLEIAAFMPGSDVVMNGNWIAYPTIMINGPLTGLLIQNVSTGEKLQFTNTVAVGRVVFVDLSFGSKTVTLDDGTNLVGYVSNDSDLGTFHLQPGLNRIEIYASGASGITSLTMQWNDRYVGI